MPDSDHSIPDDKVAVWISMLGGDSDRDIIYAIMRGLREVGERAVLPLIEVLRDTGNPWGLRARAAGTLGMIKDERSVAPLVAALEDSDAQVRWHALKALVDMRERRALPQLRRMAATDEEWFSITGTLLVFLRNEARIAIEEIESAGDKP